MDDQSRSISNNQCNNTLIQAANTLISNSKSSVFRNKNVEVTSAYRKKNELNFSIDLITRM